MRCEVIKLKEGGGQQVKRGNSSVFQTITNQKVPLKKIFSAYEVCGNCSVGMKCLVFHLS